MGWHASYDPECGNQASCDAVEQVIIPRAKDLGRFEVRRALPSKDRQMVGPFIFFDQMGPAEFLTGQGLDVRPHPHIGLSTVTYLFSGEITHKDSLGSDLIIRPGAVNWMQAGRGIVHSERTRLEARQQPTSLFGIQSWVALPESMEEAAPAFAHHDAAALPVLSDKGCMIRLVAGKLFGMISPVITAWDTLYADIVMAAGAHLPLDAAYEERAIYTVKGTITIQGDTFGPRQLLVLREGDGLMVKALTDCRFILCGGATMDGPRHIWWNFVSSRKERIDQAKEDWKKGRFDTVPGDEQDFIPLP
jgi:redox-sensitive bicupin YhaK (pirin superfamily)